MKFSHDHILKLARMFAKAQTNAMNRYGGADEEDEETYLKEIKKLYKLPSDYELEPETIEQFKKIIPFEKDLDERFKRQLRKKRPRTKRQYLAQLEREQELEEVLPKHFKKLKKQDVKERTFRGKVDNLLKQRIKSEDAEYYRHSNKKGGKKSFLKRLGKGYEFAEDYDEGPEFQAE